MPASQTTMEAYLGSRYAGDWVVNNGKTGILYVGAVDLVNADQKYASSHLRMGSDASVKFVNEKYSMTQLDAFDEVVEKYINSHTKGKNLGQHLFDSFGVSPPDNAVNSLSPDKMQSTGYRGFNLSCHMRHLWFSTRQSGQQPRLPSSSNEVTVATEASA